MRTIVSGGFELAVSADDAIGFFTPEGERDWVPGWNPVYPSGEVSETPGTVFTTDAGGVETIWVVQKIDHHTCVSAYTRVTPGHHAGTVQVECEDRPEGGCLVSVTYDMSLVPGSDPKGLNAYDDESFAAMMGEWATAVSQKLGL